MAPWGCPLGGGHGVGLGGQVGAVFEKFLMTAFQNRLSSILKSIKNLCFLLPLPTPADADRPRRKICDFCPHLPPPRWPSQAESRSS